MTSPAEDPGPAPTIGRIVHYHPNTHEDSGPFPAIITAVYDGSGPYRVGPDLRRVDLFVMTPWSETRKTYVGQGQWSWPTS